MAARKGSAGSSSGSKAVDFLALGQLPKEAVYCLVGSDDFLREEILTRLRRELLDPGFADFNFQSLRCGPGLKMSQLTDALMELPVMTDLRLLELRAAESLTAKQVEELLPILAQLRRQGGLALVLTFESSKGKAELLEAVRAQALLISTDLDEKERQRWAQARRRDMGLEMSTDAFDSLLQRTGAELRLVAGHLDKLKLFAGEGGTVSLRDVELMVPLSAEVQTWRLTAAIGSKDLNGAYQILDRLLERGEPAGSLLSYLNSYLGSLAQIKSLKRELGSVAAIAKAMPRKNEYQIKKSLEEAATWRDGDLATAFDRLTRADLRMKTGDEERLLLQLLLLQLCNRQSAREGVSR